MPGKEPNREDPPYRPWGPSHPDHPDYGKPTKPKLAKGPSTEPNDNKRRFDV